MAKKNQTYQYKPGDSPAELAKRFGTTPEAVIRANPGAYPFNRGQTINLPNRTPQGYAGVPQGQALPGFAPQSNAVAQYLPGADTKSTINPFGQYNYMTPSKVFQRGLQSSLTTPYQSPFNKGGQPLPQYAGAIGRIEELRSQMAGLSDQIRQPGQEQYRADRNAFGQQTAENQYAYNASTQGSNNLPLSGVDYGQPVGEQVINGKKYVVDDQGQRIDPTTGQVAWSPKTATTDIYGGQFRYEGQTKFMRNKNGNIQKYFLGKDNKWHVIKRRGGGGGGGGGGGTTGSEGGSSQSAPLTQVGLVNFNAGAG